MKRLLEQRGRRARNLGRRAEWATRCLLWLQGWEVVACNVRAGRWELDLLVARGEELRLVEVKARRSGAWVAADTALAFDQRQRLQGALVRVLDRYPWPGYLTFQRVSWAGWRCCFHPVERWESLKIHR